MTARATPRCKCCKCCSTTFEAVPQTQMTISSATDTKAAHRTRVETPVGVTLLMQPCVRAHQCAQIGNARVLQRADMGTVVGGGVA